MFPAVLKLFQIVNISLNLFTKEPFFLWFANIKQKTCKTVVNNRKVMTNDLYRDICGTKNLVIYKNGTAMHVSILIMLKHIKYQIGIEYLCFVPCMLFLYFFFELQ